jgi:hypothetical protein
MSIYLLSKYFDGFSKLMDDLKDLKDSGTSPKISKVEMIGSGKDMALLVSSCV